MQYEMCAQNGILILHTRQILLEAAAAATARELFCYLSLHACRETGNKQKKVEKRRKRKRREIKMEKYERGVSPCCTGEEKPSAAENRFVGGRKLTSSLLNGNNYFRKIIRGTDKRTDGQTGCSALLRTKSAFAAVGNFFFLLSFFSSRLFSATAL